VIITIIINKTFVLHFKMEKLIVNSNYLGSILTLLYFWRSHRFKC